MNSFSNLAKIVNDGVTDGRQRCQKMQLNPIYGIGPAGDAFALEICRLFFLAVRRGSNQHSETFQRVAGLM